MGVFCRLDNWSDESILLSVFPAIITLSRSRLEIFRSLCPSFAKCGHLHRVRPMLLIMIYPPGLLRTVACIYMCVYGHTYSKSMDQPGKVANPACGQLNRGN